MNNQQNIINWTYKLPKNCSPIDEFLVTLKQIIVTIAANSQLHIILDAREVHKISIHNKMKMDAFWRRFKKELTEKVYYTTLYVETDEQQVKLEKIYQSSKSCTPYRIILHNELQYILQQTEEPPPKEESNEMSNNVILN